MLIFSCVVTIPSAFYHYSPPSNHFLSFSNGNQDFFASFSPLEKFLFQRFEASARSVISDGMIDPAPTPARNYGELIDTLQQLTLSVPSYKVNEYAKHMLVRLFPRWLLVQFKAMFAQPFPAFSCWMNAWVTKFTTNWLMGESNISDLILEDGSVGWQRKLTVKKCRFLETAGCSHTCVHACKIPTQRFFSEEMGIPVTLSPNMSDLSCTFEFGNTPNPIEIDPLLSLSCLEGCRNVAKRGRKMESPCLSEI